MYDSTNKIIYKLYAWKNADATTPLVYTKEIPTSTSEALYNSSGVAIAGTITAYTSTTITATVGGVSVLYTYSIADDKGVSMYDIQKALGRTVNDLGCLCADVQNLYAWSDGTTTYYTTIQSPSARAPLYTVSNQKRTLVGLVVTAQQSGGVVTSVTFESVTYSRSSVSDTTIPVGKIKKWNKNKPIVHTALFTTTNAQRQLAGYGFEIPTEITITDASSRGAALTLAASGNYGWSYTAPTGGSNSAYRYADFIGYNAKCKCPFVMEVQDTTTESGYLIAWIVPSASSKTATIYIGTIATLPTGNMGIQNCSNALGQPGEITSFNNPYQDKCYGVIYRIEGETNANIISMYDAKENALYPVGKWDSENGDPIWYQELSLSLQVGTYELCGIIDNTARGATYLVPGSFMKLKVQRMPNIAISSYAGAANGADDMNISVTIIRNGSVAYWINHNTSISSIGATAYIRWKNNSSQATWDTHSINANVVKSSAVYLEWNGGTNKTTNLTNSGSAVFNFAFSDMHDFMNDLAGYVDAIVEVNIELNINNSFQTIVIAEDKAFLETIFN